MPAIMVYAKRFTLQPLSKVSFHRLSVPAFARGTSGCTHKTTGCGPIPHPVSILALSHGLGYMVFAVFVLLG